MFLNMIFFFLFNFLFVSWILKHFFMSWPWSESMGQPYIVYITESWRPPLSPDGPWAPLSSIFKCSIFLEKQTLNQCSQSSQAALETSSWFSCLAPQLDTLTTDEMYSGQHFAILQCFIEPFPKSASHIHYLPKSVTSVFFLY